MTHLTRKLKWLTLCFRSTGEYCSVEPGTLSTRVHRYCEYCLKHKVAHFNFLKYHKRHQYDRRRNHNLAELASSQAYKAKIFHCWTFMHILSLFRWVNTARVGCRSGQRLYVNGCIRQRNMNDSIGLVQQGLCAVQAANS